jgi:hypothetical protein
LFRKGATLSHLAEIGVGSKFSESGAKKGGVWRVGEGGGGMLGVECLKQQSYEVLNEIKGS